MRHVAVVALGLWIAGCFQVALADNPGSPLYGARHSATLSQWESGALPDADEGENVPWWPASANPVSLCGASACPQSLCFGSLCVNSACLGSGCGGSLCAGSACITSSCLGSGCGGSLCGGSACLGNTLCIRECGGNGEPTYPVDPGYSNVSYSPLSCPEY